MSEKQAEITDGMTQEQVQIYQMIEDSGSQGCLKSSFKNVDKKLTIQKITQILKKM